MRRLNAMSTDQLTTILGMVAAVATGVAQMNVKPEVTGPIGAISLALMGYYTNKGKK